MKHFRILLAFAVMLAASVPAAQSGPSSAAAVTRGELVGVDVTWAPPSNGVPNTLPNKFDPWTYAHDVRVPAGIDRITITSTTMSRKAAWMKLNGVVIESGTSHSVAVADGSQTRLEILAPDGVTASIYVFTASADWRLRRGPLTVCRGAVSLQAATCPQYST